LTSNIIILDSRPVRVFCLDAAPPSPFSPPVTLPILLLHGLGCSSEVWMPAYRILAARHLACPVFVPDFPGFGYSPGPAEAMGMEDLAEWTVRLLDALGVWRVHLAAHSMGCQVALALARKYPERVGGLVLVGPTVGEQAIPFWRYALGLLLDGFREPPIYNLTLARMYAQMGLSRYLATTRKMLEDQPLRSVGTVGTPCLVVRGQYDGIIPDAAARRLAAALPHGEFQRFYGTAHALQFSRPREFVETALAFWALVEEKEKSPQPPIMGEQD
jgi:pimeloyl-ACP methyl ester carboxylesterase